MPTTFTVSDVKYSTGMLNGLTQFHVSRRLSPLLSIMPSIVKGRRPGDVATPIEPERVKEVLGEALRVIGEMKDEDVNYVLEACLSQVSRWDERSQEWYAVWNAAARKPMFDDINMIVMIMICFHVIKVSLGPFTLASSIAPTA